MTDFTLNAQTRLHPDAYAGIKLYTGVQGSADEAVSALAAGTLDYDPDVRCNHHKRHDGEYGHDHCVNHHCKGN